jgi:3',5'-nucleoside bisphosphate phosphatase
MRRLCDLHTHSNHSDGDLSPRELVRLASRKRLAGLALTDHDTVAGLAEAAEAAAEDPQLTFIPGVEVSAAFPQGTLHILGLCIDPAGVALADLTARLLDARNERNPRIVAKLRAMGVDITMDEVLSRAGVADQAGGVVGRAHIAAVLMRKGYARDLADAFARYLSPGAPAFVDKERLAPAQAIAAIHDARGLAILAHPVQLQFGNFAECERMVRSLQDAGLDGLEAYHSDHSDVETRFFLDLARRLDMAVAGGSDYHGSIKAEVRLGHPPVPASVMETLLSRARR